MRKQFGLRRACLPNLEGIYDSKNGIVEEGRLVLAISGLPCTHGLLVGSLWLWPGASNFVAAALAACAGGNEVTTPDKRSNSVHDEDKDQASDTATRRSSDRSSERASDPASQRWSCGARADGGRRQVDYAPVVVR